MLIAMIQKKRKNKMMARTNIVATLIVVLVTAQSATAQDAGTPMPGTLSAAYPGKAYSPYAKRSFPERPLWG